MKKIHFSDSECEEVFQNLGRLLEQLEDIEDEKIKAKFVELMKHFDVIHREALARMWKYLAENHPESQDRFRKDYVIRHLTAVYDLEPFSGLDPNFADKRYVSIKDEL